MKKEDLIKLGVSIIGVQMAGILGSVFTITSVESWYAMLEKPAFQPPNWVFGPVWTTLYLLIAISLFLVWRLDAKKVGRKEALTIFLVQIILNFLWSILFFGLQSPLLALIEISILWGVILLNIAVFYRLSKTAAILLVPYLAWVSFASFLNFSIWILN